MPVITCKNGNDLTNIQVNFIHSMLLYSNETFSEPDLDFTLPQYNDSELYKELFIEKFINLFENKQRNIEQAYIIEGLETILPEEIRRRFSEDFLTRNHALSSLSV